MKFYLQKNNTSCNLWIYAIVIVFIYFLFSLMTFNNICKFCNKKNCNKKNCNKNHH